MKKIMYKAALLIVSAMSVSYAAQAQAYLQDPKYGNTPEERKENVLRINYFNDAYKNKNYNHCRCKIDKSRLFAASSIHTLAPFSLSTTLLISEKRAACLIRHASLCIILYSAFTLAAAA